MSNTKPIVHLRVYKSNGFGTKISKSEDGEIQNENYVVKEIYNTLEWKNYLKHIGVHGFIRVDVEKVTGEADKDLIQKEVNRALNPEEDKPQTPEQKRIAELEAKLEAFMKSGKNDIDDELTKAREEYVKVFGKKGHHTWSAEQIKEKILEEQNKS